MSFALDGRDDDDEWTTKGHNRAYATAALAEQNAVITSSTYDHIVPTYAIVDKKTQQNHLQQLQQLQQQQQAHVPYIQYNTLIPVGKMSAAAAAYASQAQAAQQQQQQQQSQQQQPLNKVNLLPF